MKFLTNIYDPKLPDAIHHIGRMSTETLDDAWKRHLEWLEDKVIGDPWPIGDYTVSKLKSLGMVGVYQKE